MSAALEVRPGALEDVRRAGLLVLDVDGVLLDPRPSFYAAAKEVSLWAAARALGRDPGPGPADEEIGAYKAAGGFNDDFDLASACAYALVARAVLPGAPGLADTARESAGGGLAAVQALLSARLPSPWRERAEEACGPRVVRPRCAARYAGLARCHELYGIEPAAHSDLPQDGLWPLEPVLCDPALLRAAPLPLALFTGRSRGEAWLALTRLELSVDEEWCVVDDGSCARKPSPEGLLRLARQSGRPLVFAGDSIDDQRAAQAYAQAAQGAGLPPITFVRVLGAAATTLGAESGADLVTQTLDELLHAAFPGAVR